MFMSAITRARQLVIVTGAFVASGLLVVCAQSGQTKAPMSDADYQKAMKDIGPAFMALQRDNASMSHADGEKQAQLLSDRFKEVQAYWEAKKVSDAVEFAKSAVAAADATIKASSAMDMTTLTSSQQKLQAACAGCHMAHRERLPDGSYKMK